MQMPLLRKSLLSYIPAVADALIEEELVELQLLCRDSSKAKLKAQFQVELHLELRSPQLSCC